MNYAQILDVPTAISSNGSGFLEHDFSGLNPKVERELGMDAFPSPDELWARYRRYKGIDTLQEERVADHEYHFDGTGRSPRYYQQIAVNRTVEAIAGGQKRILIVMATGTGKTYAAFQIIRKKKIDKAYEIYLALYQGITNYDEDADAYRQFSPEFFDLIVVDECRRGSAAEDSA
jgi:type I restriction enzyme R subunit